MHARVYACCARAWAICSLRTLQTRPQQGVYDVIPAATWQAFLEKTNVLVTNRAWLTS